ncbi:coiled-coil domain-containing protein 102A [Sergentomyia squamirostris]
MSQGVATAASLGAPPRRFRGDSATPQNVDPTSINTSGGVGNSQSARFEDSEWDARESQRQRELEEARARASQMEKTLQWWSDCTSNWREKWSKVRTERNKARDEAKQLRSSLESAIKESNAYKREKCELEIQISHLKKEMEKIHMLLMKHAGQFDKSTLEAIEDADRDARDKESPDVSSDGLKNVNSEDGLVMKSDHKESRDLDIEGCMLQGASKPSETEDNDERSAEEHRLIQQLSKDDSTEEEYLQQKISVLKLRLDDAHKCIQREKEERLLVQNEVERLTLEMQEVKAKCEELRLSKQEAVRELLTIQEQHRAEVRISNNSLQEEINARESLERRLCELRGELERMQAENAAEWGKRERLETEKLILERDNKKLRGELRDFQERVDRRGRPLMPADVEVRNLQQEIAEKNKEISELRHAGSKMKKMLSECNTELGHAVRRAEQYEAEVKRLRSRVEELKRELARVEDELDTACSHVRRLQRVNEELGGVEGFQLVTSPKQQAYYGSSSSYKPNINDLRQLFDDTKRTNDPRKSQDLSKCQQVMYHDAKGSFVDSDVLVDSRSKANMFDFERAKQKFDKSGKIQGKGLGSCGSKSTSVSGKKINDGDFGISKQNFNETVQFFDENVRKKDAYMKTSLNLDGLKVHHKSEQLTGDDGLDATNEEKND